MIRNYFSEEKTEPIYGYYDGDHLYGIAPVRMALCGARRNISELLVQTSTDFSNKKDETSAKEIISMAQKLNIPIREFSKHDLNMLSDNRPVDFNHHWIFYNKNNALLSASRIYSSSETSPI